MKSILQKYRRILVQIATPYSTGTGFYVADYGLIVTNEHVVRNNCDVIVEGADFHRQLVRVLFTDQKLDLAFLEAPPDTALPPVVLSNRDTWVEDIPVVAVGHPFGSKFSYSQGQITDVQNANSDIPYLQHDAVLSPGYSGGPLIDTKGVVVGVNTFIVKNGRNLGFSLPVNYLVELLNIFKNGKAKTATRCTYCETIVFENELKKDKCPHCGKKVILPIKIPAYTPTGMAYTIEEMLTSLGYNVQLARRGPNNWEIHKGSASINISYYEKNGLITGDAYLCTLTEEHTTPVYEYLLRQNYQVEGLTLSVKGNEVILSLLIYDRYLNTQTGVHLLEHLFERADYYDNVLVEQFGAKWIEEV